MRRASCWGDRGGQRDGVCRHRRQHGRSRGGVTEPWSGRRSVTPLIIVSASGGARMMEGVTAHAAGKISARWRARQGEGSLHFLLTDPTTGA